MQGRNKICPGFDFLKVKVTSPGKVKQKRVFNPEKFVESLKAV